MKPLTFANKKGKAAASQSEGEWKILIVDDEPGIHQVTKMVLSKVSYQNKDLTFISAHSKNEALRLLKTHADIAIILLDVVMEEEDSGLQLVEIIRTQLNNHFVRIIIRTGQPGQFPERHVILNYEINDYTSKTELTVDRLFTRVISSLRSYERIQMLQKITHEKVGLEIELKAASQIQKSIFPKSFPQVASLEFASFIEPAEQVGGDWFGFIDSIENTLFILIGDVIGHGLPSAMVAFAANTTTKVLEGLFSSPNNRRTLRLSDCIKNLNNSIHRTGAPNFLMTFFASSIDLKTGKMEYINAGHNFPIHIDTEGNSKQLLNINPRLGETPNIEFSVEYTQLGEGDTLIFYTDGLVENENPEGIMWHTRRLVQCVKQYHSLPIKKVVDSIVEEAYTFYDNCPLQDDLALLGCQVTSSFE